MSESFFLGSTEDRQTFETPDENQRPIDLLTPGSDHHEYVLNYLLARLRQAEERMTQFYSRWQIAERKFQAYLSLPNYEQMLKDMNNNSSPPAPAIIVFPYNYASISTAVTYFMKAFCGKKPFFPLGADSFEASEIIRFMEAMTQKHLDATSGVMKIFQIALDGELYGVGAVRCTWKTRRGRRRVVRALSPAERLSFSANPSGMPSLVRDHEERIVWQGNDLLNIDPYMFFPDPNVPMHLVSEKGEYVFWREFLGKHILIQGQKEGGLKYVDTVEPSTGSQHDSRWYNLSQRSLISSGQAHAGENTARGSERINNTYMVDQGSVEIIPSELGLGPEDYPVKYIFTILNKSQIVQAEPLDLDHGRHPVEVSEPHTMGYGFGQPAMGDYIGPIQDLLSWFIDSHVYNVRSALNNQWLYDPSKIDVKSLKYPQPGKFIPLKPTAYGQDVRAALAQFPVTDVTRNHMADLQTFVRIGDMVSSVNDPMRGVTSAGGRRTATEVRRTDENAFGRLGERAVLISQMCLTRLAEQIVLNVQQLQDPDTWIKVIGKQNFDKFGQQLLTADFTYRIHDGTLPLDRVASFDFWKELLLGMAQSPILTKTHSLPRVFEYVAELGGANNISSFRLMADTEIDNLVKQGNMIPLNEAPGNVPQMPNGGLPQ